MILHTRLENRNEIIKVIFTKGVSNKVEIIKLKDNELNLYRELKEVSNCHSIY